MDFFIVANLEKMLISADHVVCLCLKSTLNKFIICRMLQNNLNSSGYPNEPDDFEHGFD